MWNVLFLFSDLYMLRLEKFQNLPVNKIELLGFHLYHIYYEQN